MSIPVPHAHRSGFTLLELLISIAIISILAALLFSATGAIRRHQDATLCMQRLRATGTALLANAADNRGMLLPRFLGRHRDSTDPKVTIPEEERGWPIRLLKQGYASSPDVFYCPAFFPKKNNLATHPLPSAGKLQTFGLRVWTLPGVTNFASDKGKEELKPLAAIESPSDFFLLADTIWIHSAWMSQGYGISPELRAEQLLHLRHSGKANAFFADGHVEAKPGSYFEELHLTTRQRAYSGGQSLQFGVTDRMDWPKPQ